MSGAGQDRPRRWPIGNETVRAVLSGHGILGLAFAAIIYLVCLTGTIVVFAPDIERWEHPAAPQATALTGDALDRAIASARAAVPAGATLYATLPTKAAPGAVIVAYGPALEREWAVAGEGGLVETAAPLSEFLIGLHIALHLPRAWGGFIVGLTGVALLSSLISGVLAHPRVFRDAFHLRLGGSRRLQEADLHNRLGIWPLPFHLAIAITGALLGLSSLIVGMLSLLLFRGDTDKVYGLFLDAPPAVNAAAAPVPAMAALVARARAAAPEAEPYRLIVERAGRADARYTVQSRRPRQITAQDEIVFDAAGRIVGAEHPDDLVTGTKVLNGVGQLHFGWFGGVPVRIAWGLLGLALCVVTSSGVTIWLARRRDKGRAVPRWERLWAAVAWGQPLALMLVALTAFALPAARESPVWPWLGLTAALLLAAGVMRHPASAIARVLRIALAGAAIVLALAHAAIAPFALTAAIVDLALLAGGAGLLWRSLIAAR